MTGFSVTFLCDYAAEGWPSMDLVGRCLPEALERRGVRVRRHQPAARRWFGSPASEPWTPSIRERVINRYAFYPRSLSPSLRRDGVFHVVDHSYAHLVHALPAARTVVTCHDLDAFECVLDPARSPQPWLFRTLVGRTLRGLQRAGTIVCVSQWMRDELVRRGVAEPQRLVVVPNGIHPAFIDPPDADADDEAARLLGPRADDTHVNLLHVGIPIARKRIDVAVDVLARLRADHVPARLIRAGGTLPGELRARAERLGVARYIVELPFLRPAALAAVYRRASVLLVPSEREGFALPIVEALASGTPVIANDIAVLRETGGDLATYRGNGDAAGWCRDVHAIRARQPEEARRWTAGARSYAGQYSWSAAVERLLPVYQALSSR